jgi:hypothetical protein
VLEVIGAHVRVVGHDKRARLQAALDQAQDLRIQRLGAVEQNEVVCAYIGSLDREEQRQSLARN